MNIAISFVVDDVELHYYQAELLLYSIAINSNIQKENILVQCTSRVSEKFTNYLDKHSYHYRYIEPYLDGKYCNKLQQLDYFFDKDVDAVVLVDTDMYILDDISDLNYDKIYAKVVDGSNPTLNTLKRIYSEAGIVFPKTIDCDWTRVNNKTIEANFNGGFYYIPKKNIKLFSEYWRKWASFLYEKQDLFLDRRESIHIDQVSFSLALHDLNLPFGYLAANYNYPTHSTEVPNSYNDKEELYVVHYHRAIDSFGFLETSNIKVKSVLDSINKINTQLVAKKHFNFFKNYKKSLINKLNFSTKVLEFKNKLDAIMTDKDKKKIILHAGTPKTGTTTFQFLLHKNEELLKKNALIYPDVDLSKYVPKHQWIVQLLKNNDFDNLFLNLQRCVDICDKSNINTMILSSEGIYNHWWDFSDEAKSVLNIINDLFNIELWVCFREPISFLQSYYKQNIKNPQNNAAECYGKDMSFSQMCDDKWFIQHLDYLGFIYSCEKIFRKGNIKVFEYSKTIIKHMLNELGLEKVEIEIKDDKNIGLSSIAVEILKVINRYNLDAKDKKYIVSEVSKLDNVLSKYSHKIDDEATIKKLIDKFSIQNKLLRENYLN